MKKLDNLLKFRDNEKFKVFTKVFTIITLAAFLVTMGFVCAWSKDDVRPLVFAILPLFMLVSLFRKNDYLFILAEFITIIADIFLILLKKIDVGFPIYLFVQLTYAAYFFFRDENNRRKFNVLIFRAALMLIATIVMFVLKKNSVKFIFGSMYFVNIIINVIYAAIFKDPLLIVGFAIFMISDAFIGLSLFNISAVNNFLSKFNFVYFTYLISQVILMFNKHTNDYTSKK